MKNILYISLIFSSLLISCEKDFLDRQPYDSLSTTTIWTSDHSAILAINGIYSALHRQGAFGYFFCNFSNLGPDGTTNAGGAIQMGNSTTRTDLYLTVYTDFYRIIKYANEAIVNLPGNTLITESLRDRLLGEAKFLRGLAYFYLWQLYGGVVILDKPMLASETYLPRNTADDVKNLIISDFSDAVSLLPVSYSDVDMGRATKGAAIAMLGKTYLFDQQWSKASAEFAKLLTSPFDYELHPEYYQLFDYKWENNKEVIFYLDKIMQPGYGSPYDMLYGTRSARCHGWNVGNASYIAVANYTKTDGSAINMASMPKREDYDSEHNYGLALIPWYQSTFDESQVDKRLHGNIIMPGFLFKAENNIVRMLNWPYNTHINDKPYPAIRTNWSGYAIFPWRKLVNVGNENAIRWDSPNNLPIIRYADVLLMYAEAKNEASGPSSDVYDAVNMVRKRAGVINLPAGLSKDQMRKEIRLERLRELAGEGHLFFDVRRWRTAATNDPVFGLNHDVLDFRGIKLYTRVFTERDYLWPIPGQEMDLNKNLIQNPGW